MPAVSTNQIAETMARRRMERAGVRLTSTNAMVAERCIIGRRRRATGLRRPDRASPQHSHCPEVADGASRSLNVSRLSQ